MNQSWSIIILCYNEEGNLRTVVTELNATLKKMSVTDYEIIVVDDGSTDNSRNVIKDLSNEVPQIVLKSHKVNLGIGQAIRTGFFSAQKENVMAMAGDGQFNIKDLIPHANINNNTMISFYRVDKGPYTAFRHFISNFNRWLNHYVLGAKIKDVNWVKIYKNENLNKIKLELKSSLVETEIVTKLLRESISLEEYQTVYLPRLYGEPKGASFKVVSMALLELIRLIFILRVRRIILGY
jgi:dolichol-phosphate mannosyltransferase